MDEDVPANTMADPKGDEEKADGDHNSSKNEEDEAEPERLVSSSSEELLAGSDDYMSGRRLLSAEKTRDPNNNDSLNKSSNADDSVALLYSGKEKIVDVTAESKKKRPAKGPRGLRGPDAEPFKRSAVSMGKLAMHEFGRTVRSSNQCRFPAFINVSKCINVPVGTPEIRSWLRKRRICGGKSHRETRRSRR